MDLKCNVSLRLLSVKIPSVKSIKVQVARVTLKKKRILSLFTWGDYPGKQCGVTNEGLWGFLL